MPFSPDQLAYAGALFELQVYRSDGQAYENLFVRVMTRAEPEFRPIKPRGPHGDKKNDGYCAAASKYYQVYAPENHSAKNASEAVSKIETDFAGLKSYWDVEAPVREYRFVINDKFKGTFPDVETTLLRIKNLHGLTVCGPFLNKDLVQIFEQLNDHNIIAIVGHLPVAEEITDLDYSMFTVVLNHIIETAGPITPEGFLRVPDFSEKIRLNRISKHVAQLLETGNLQSGAVEAFFNGHGNFSKTAIRDQLARIYTELRERIGQSSTSGDVIFFGLLDAVIPGVRQRHVQDAAIVLLAYFFESCDIYEDPNLL